MKKESGFTLVELMVVISITVLLLAWGIPSYSTWNKKHNIENQMIQLYSDLQFGRMNAYGNKVVSGILWSNNFSTYQILYISQSDGFNGTIDTGGSTVQGTTTVNLRYPVTSVALNTTTQQATNQQSVSFNGRGFLYTTYAPDTANQITYYVTPSYGALMDCVQVSTTQIILGNWNGTTCKQN